MTKTCPVQRTHDYQLRGAQSVPEAVHLEAYKVYCEIHGDQPALVEGNCRSGFSVSELVAFLYAGNFPKDEWSVRVYEAWQGMRL